MAVAGAAADGYEERGGDCACGCEVGCAEWAEGKKHAEGWWEACEAFFVWCHVMAAIEDITSNVMI